MLAKENLCCLYMGGNSVKKNSSFRINKEKKTYFISIKKPVSLASNPRKNQAGKQF